MIAFSLAGLCMWNSLPFDRHWSRLTVLQFCPA